MDFRDTDFSKIRIDYLLAFQQLAECESFSETAKIFGKSQGTISQQLKELEKSLGNVTLITRTSQKFELTEYGKILNQELEIILPKLETAYKKIALNAKMDEYEIDLLASSIPGEYVLPKIMMDFQHNYPKTTFSVKIKNSESALEALINNQVNICAVGGFASYHPKNFEIKPLETDSIVVFARKDHPIHAEEHPGEHLSEYPWIFREVGSATREIFLSHFPWANDLKIALEFQDNTAIINAVQASDAISALSFNLISIYKNQGIKEIKLTSIKPIKRTLYLVKRKDDNLKTYEKSFWDNC